MGGGILIFFPLFSTAIAFQFSLRPYGYCWLARRMMRTFRGEEEKKRKFQNLFFFYLCIQPVNMSLGCCTGILKPLGPQLRPLEAPHPTSHLGAALLRPSFSEWLLHLSPRPEPGASLLLYPSKFWQLFLVDLLNLCPPPLSTLDYKLSLVSIDDS